MTTKGYTSSSKSPSSTAALVTGKAGFLQAGRHSGGSINQQRQSNKSQFRFKTL